MSAKGKKKRAWRQLMAEVRTGRTTLKPNKSKDARAASWQRENDAASHNRWWNR